MGSYESTESKDDVELQKYLRDGLNIKDVRNIKKAFNLLDTEKIGLIKYEKVKIEDVSKYQMEGDFVILNLDQFMEIMIEKILFHRKKYKDKILFESNVSSVSCFFCPSRTREDKDKENQ